jgi:hypothetical protein
VTSEFQNWVQLFDPIRQFRGILPQEFCSKCENVLDADKEIEHLQQYHRYDLQDGIIIQVNNKWWRRRGVKTEGKKL